MCKRRKLRAALASTTSPPPTSVIEMRTTFRRRLTKFRQFQAQYQPEVLSIVPPPSQSASPTDPDINVIQDTPLLLPSSLPPEHLLDCSRRLVKMEAELRIGQCRDSLTQLRINLTAQARLLKHKYVNVRHQIPNTRSGRLLIRVNGKIEACAIKYRHAFETLQVLDPSNSFGWRSEFLELKPQDVRGMAQPELPSAPTQERAEELFARTLLNGRAVPEGNRTVSWIWRGSLQDDSGNSDGEAEYGEGLSLYLYCVFTIIDDKQNFDSSGPRHEHDRPAGRRRWRFSWRRCGGFSSSSSGSRIIGSERVIPNPSPCYPPAHFSSRAYAHTLRDRPRFSMRFASTFWAFGVASRSRGNT